MASRRAHPHYYVGLTGPADLRAVVDRARTTKVCELALQLAEKERGSPWDELAAALAFVERCADEGRWLLVIEAGS